MKQEAFNQLKNAGVPEKLASQAAEIVARDDASKPNLGRSEADQQIISEAHKHIKR